MTSKTVKCRATGVEGTADSFFKKGRYYYQNKALYEWYEREETAKKKINQFVCVELFDYKNSGYNPSYFYKLLKQLHEKYSYEEILITLQTLKGQIELIQLNKSFESYAAATSYIWAVVKSNIETIIKKADKENAETKIVTTDELRNMADLLNLQTEQGMTKQKTKNISKWLEEG